MFLPTLFNGAIDDGKKESRSRIPTSDQELDEIIDEDDESSSLKRIVFLICLGFLAGAAISKVHEAAVREASDIGVSTVLGSMGIFALVGLVSLPFFMYDRLAVGVRHRPFLFTFIVALAIALNLFWLSFTPRLFNLREVRLLLSVYGGVFLFVLGILLDSQVGLERPSSSFGGAKNI